jgi:hypothetical protein
MNDLASVSSVADTAGNLAKFMGDSAKMALTIGNVALPIIEFVLPWVPGLGPIAADIEIALPIIQKIATYAPQVQAVLQQGGSMIDAVTGIGDALLMPLKNLFSLATGTAASSVEVAMIEKFIAGTFERSFFTPQDPRFERASGGANAN